MLSLLFVISSKSQLANEKTGENQEEQITNGRIQTKDKEEKEDKEDKEEKEDAKENEEEEETWEVLKSTVTAETDRIGTNGMVKKIQ